MTITVSGYAVYVQCARCGFGGEYRAEFETLAWQRVRRDFVVNRTERQARCRNGADCAQRVVRAAEVKAKRDAARHAHTLTRI